jgi:hypothetical protein
LIDPSVLNIFYSYVDNDVVSTYHATLWNDSDIERELEFRARGNVKMGLGWVIGEEWVVRIRGETGFGFL